MLLPESADLSSDQSNEPPCFFGLEVRLSHLSLSCDMRIPKYECDCVIVCVIV